MCENKGFQCFLCLIEIFSKIRPGRLMETRSFNRDFSKENKPGRLIETGRSFVTRHKIEMNLVV